MRRVLKSKAGNQFVIEVESGGKGDYTVTTIMDGGLPLSRVITDSNSCISVVDKQLKDVTDRISVIDGTDSLTEKVLKARGFEKISKTDNSI